MFKTKKLQKLCENQAEMVKALGPITARKLRARLSDLQAAANLIEIRRGRPHRLKGEFDRCVAIDLSGGARLVIEPISPPDTSSPDGVPDLAQIDTVLVVFVGDYHD